MLGNGRNIEERRGSRMNDIHGEAQENLIGLKRSDYRGLPSTLCQGCGHNSIANQIISACFELNIRPENVIKLSGIGCASKSPAYFLRRSFGFNGLHGRMPSLATGALIANTSLRGIGISGDGDTASIGLSQFKHMVRRNVPFVYIVENNGVYGLTKGQYSATAEQGLQHIQYGPNPYTPVDICMEALISNATFVARSFAGDPKQVKELIKAAFHHEGIAVLDIISPCVTFNNQEDTLHSYRWGMGHETPLHTIAYVPPRDEITVDDFEEGSTMEVELHDGSIVILKKLEEDYDPTDRWQAIHMLEEAFQNNWLITGLLYVDIKKAPFYEVFNLPDMPMNRLPDSRLRPPVESIEVVNDLLLSGH
jgi:2-oxoglutarate/2-oxoacid ferredoxin oxidoreductase subunit beta